MADILITSGNSFDGYRIEQYFTPISFEQVEQIQTLSLTRRSMSSNELEKMISHGKDIALNGIINKAKLKGANAIIGFRYQYLNFYPDKDIASISSKDKKHTVCIIAEGIPVNVNRE